MLRGALEGVALDLATLHADSGMDSRSRALRVLSDHVLPRLDSLDAPLLAVIGGPTGAGKSTVLNSLLGRKVSVSSAIRPTTRRPVLVHAADDGAWFDATRVLPSLARVRVEADAEPSPAQFGGDRELELRESDTLPAGLALLDAPDLDSVVADNRALARQLLDAADLWVFVTTAARYADAVPWEVLEQAGTRGIEVAVVLNRVPSGALELVSNDLRSMLVGRGLAAASLFRIEEQPLDDGLFPDSAVRELHEWLLGLALDSRSRADIARRALTGSVSEVVGWSGDVAEALREHDEAIGEALGTVDAEIDLGMRHVRVATEDGTLLRGEVLARWQEVVGAADLTRWLGRGVSRMRDRLTSALKSRPAPAEPVEDAIGAGLSSLVREEACRVWEGTIDEWMAVPATRRIAMGTADPDPAMLDARALEVTRQWQRDLLDLVRTQGGSRRSRARVLAIGVNIIGVALMVVLFASTGGLTGGEVGIAGATAAIAQKLLEVVFGDQAVRTMTTRAREMLEERIRALFDEVVAPLRAAFPELSEVEALTRARADVASDWAVTS